MDKYVNANKMLKEYEHGIYDTTDLAEMLYYMPAVDVVEVLHGRWVSTHNPIGQQITICSVCGKIMRQAYPNYCGNCGAKMDLENENEQV